MCAGTNPKTGRPKRKPSMGETHYERFFNRTIAKAKIDEKKYGIARTNPFESDKKYFKRVGKFRQAQVDQQAKQRKALIAQQQAESVRLQRQMTEQQEAQNKTVGGLTAQQEERISGIRRRGDAVVSSLRILGIEQPTAPSASQTPSRGKRGGARTSAPTVARGSARSRGINLSI